MSFVIHLDDNPPFKLPLARFDRAGALSLTRVT